MCHRFQDIDLQIMDLALETLNSLLFSNCSWTLVLYTISQFSNTKYDLSYVLTLCYLNNKGQMLSARLKPLQLGDALALHRNIIPFGDQDDPRIENLPFSFSAKSSVLWTIQL